MIRELTDADLPAATDLCAAGLDLPDDATEARLLVDRLLNPPTGRRTVRLYAADGAGLAFGSISDRDPLVGHVELLVVHPARRRRGAGRALLTAIEERLAALGAAEVRLGGNPPCYAWPGIDVRYTAAVCLARERGYELANTAWNMTADLTAVDPGGTAAADEARLAAAGVQVRPADRGVVEWVRSVWGDGWAWEVSQSLERAGTGCYVAWRDGKRLGFAAYGANRPSWFGPMGTDPAAGGLGIGRVLLRRCLTDQRAGGLSTAQIGWAGPIAFYSRAVGARVERVFWIYSRRR